MVDPGTILAILQIVGAASIAVCEAINKALELEHDERQALKELRKGVESLRSDTQVYKVLLTAMANDTDLNGRSPYARFIQRYVIGLRSSSYAHRPDNFNITDRTERNQWKALKGRSRLRGYC
jgi:acyl-CoA-binding protein